VIFWGGGDNNIYADVGANIIRVQTVESYWFDEFAVDADCTQSFGMALKWSSGADQYSGPLSSGADITLPSVIGSLPAILTLPRREPILAEYGP